MVTGTRWGGGGRRGGEGERCRRGATVDFEGGGRERLENGRVLVEGGGGRETGLSGGGESFFFGGGGRFPAEGVAVGVLHLSN